MATKVKKAATAKKAAPAPKASAKKASGKGTAPAGKAALQAAADAPAPTADELEEAEEAAEIAAAGPGGSAGGNAAALAAASGGTEMSASFKNFRHHPDMENFYRFIYENDLRHEALAIIDQITIEKQARRMAKGAKAQAH